MVKLCLPEVGKEEIEEISKVINSRWLAHGDYNKEFEANFAKYINVNHAVTLNSCTSAIQLALEAHNITKEVILPSFTFIASANAIIKAGATPVFVDVDYDTCNIDPSKIKEVITENTQAILPVHFAGQMCKMKEILEITEEHNLKLIEDSAETGLLRYTLKKQLSLIHQATLSPVRLVSYLFAKEIEVRNLKMLLKGKKLNVEANLVI